MSFRDDHDAALARADALAVELDATQRQHERDVRALREATSQLAREHARVAELEAKLTVPTAAPSPAPARPRPRPVAPPPPRTKPSSSPSSSKAWHIDVLIRVFALGIVVAAFVVTRPDRGVRASDAARVPDPAATRTVASDLDRASVIATTLWPDADLAGMKLDGVDASGSRDVSRTQVSFDFRSPTHPDTCIHLDGERGQFQRMPAAASCPAPRPGRARCTVTDIWQRARHDGASSTMPATLRLTASNGTRVWRFETEHFERTYLDDCR